MSPPERLNVSKTRNALKQTQTASIAKKSNSGSRSKSNSVSRSIRTFIGMGANHGILMKKSDGSTTMTTGTAHHTRPVSSKGSQQGARKNKHTANSSVRATNVEPQAKKEKIRKADEYFRQLVIRKFFCLWIEQYIQKLKMRKMHSASSLQRLKSQDLAKGEKPARYFSKQQSKSSFNAPKATESKRSKDRHQKEQAETNAKLFKDGSKSSMLISQGFFDNVVSPNSNSAILVMGNYQQDNRAPHEQRIRLSKTDISLSQHPTESNLLEESNHQESFKKVSTAKPENCFTSPFSNEREQVTRNISTITGKSDFRETAQLGSKCNDAQLEKRLSRGLKIINERLARFVGASVRRTSPSPHSKRVTPSPNKLRSMSKSRERSNSQRRDRFAMYKAIPSASKTVSGASIERCITVSAKKPTKMAHTLKPTRSISRSRSQDRLEKQNRTKMASITQKDVERLLKQKHFLKWRQIVVNLKRKPRANLKKSFLKESKGERTYNSVKAHNFYLRKTFKKVLCHLLEHTLRQKRLNDIGYKIMLQHRTISITNSFMRWIEQFNKCSIQRKKVFYASQHWYEFTIKKFWADWVYIVKYKKHHRSLLRQTVPMRCILRMLSSRIPQERIDQCDIGNELFLATQYFEMKAIDEGRMFDSVVAFQQNLKASIFNQLKTNYHRMCCFKASIAIRMATECLTAWKNWTGKEIQGKIAVKQMRNKIGIRKFTTIMQQWSNYAKYKRFLSESSAYIRRQSLRAKKRLILFAIRDFAHLKNEKALMRYRARKFLENKALAEYLRMMQVYVHQRKTEKNNQWRIRQIFVEKFKKTVFQAFRETCIKVGVLREQKRVTQSKSHKSLKMRQFKAWFLISLATKKSRQHFELVCKKQHFQLLREAVYLSQINRFKKVKADNFRCQTLKYNFLMFMRDYLYERGMVRQLRIIKQEKVQHMRLRTLFCALLEYSNRKVKTKILLEELILSHESWLKAKVIKSLRQNIYQQIKINLLESKKVRQLKKKGFNYLKLVTRKQKLLREGLIHTIQMRNYKKAQRILDFWRSRAIFEHNMKIVNKHKIREFQAKRALRNLYNNRHFMIRQRQIEFYSKNLAKLALKRKVWRILYARHKSDKIRNLRKAKLYRFNNLCAPSFTALKRQSFLKKIHNEIAEIAGHRRKREILNWWMKAVLHKQLQNQTNSYTVIRVTKKAFHALKKNRDFQICEKYNEAKALKHFKQSCFYAIKNFREHKLIFKQQKDQKISEAERYYSSHILKSWFKTCKRQVTLNRKFTIMNQRRLHRIGSHGLKLMNQVTHLLRKSRTVSQRYNHRLLRKCFHHLKCQSQQFTIPKKSLQKLQNHLTLKTTSQKKHIFYQFKFNRLWSQKYKKQETKAVQHLARYLCRKVLQILDIRRDQRKKLRALYEQQIKKTQQNMIRKYVSEMIGTYIIEPQLDSIGHKAFLRKQLQTFRRKVLYIKGRSLGTHLHKKEVMAFEYLGKNLLSKVFAGLKVNRATRQLKWQLGQMAKEFQHRKWFTMWRECYLIKAQQNYFMPVQQKIEKKQVIQVQPVQKPLNIGLPPKAVPIFSPNSTTELGIASTNQGTHLGTHVINSQRVQTTKPIKPQSKGQNSNSFYSGNITEQAQILSEKIQSRLALSRDSRSRLASGQRDGVITPKSNNEIIKIRVTSPVQNAQSPQRSPTKSSQPRQRHLQQSSSPQKVDIAEIDFNLQEDFPYQSNLHEQKSVSAQTRSFKSFLQQKLNKSPQQHNSGSKESSDGLKLSQQSLEEAYENELMPNRIYQ